MTRVRPRRLGKSQLREICERLREQVLAPGARQLATKQEVAEYWPGGPNNPGRDTDAWVECYAHMSALLARRDIYDKMSGGPDAGVLERTVRAAAARQPVPVALSIGQRNVYPKSAWALSWLDALDNAMQAFVELGAMVMATDAEELEQHRMFPKLLQGLAFRSWAWILLHEDVGVPFGEEGPIEPPAYTEQLTAEDLLAIYVAHRQLHVESIAIMSQAMPTQQTGESSRLSLSGFLAGYASEHGVAPSVIVRRWGLAEAVAAAVASAEASRVAEINAKLERARNAS